MDKNGNDARKVLRGTIAVGISIGIAITLASKGCQLDFIVAPEDSGTVEEKVELVDDSVESVVRPSEEVGD